MSELKNMYVNTLLNLERRLLDETDWNVGEMVSWLYNPRCTGVIVEKIDETRCVVLFSEFKNPFEGHPGASNSGLTITLPARIDFIRLDYEVGVKPEGDEVG